MLFLTWHIFKTIVDSLSPIVATCVLNQSRSHWLLFDALHSTITMCLKFKEEITNPSTLVSWIDDDSKITFELSLFASNIRRVICGVVDSFVSFLKKNGKKKAHNMLSLMLDPIFKNIHLISSFVA
jgi:hypothetical protein